MAKRKTKKQLTADLVTLIDRKVKLKAIGNDSRTMRDLTVDLINASGEQWQAIADGCFLAPQTVKRLAQDKTKRPAGDTLERVFRYFGYEVQLNRVAIQSRFQNAPKAGSKAEREQKQEGQKKAG